MSIQHDLTLRDGRRLVVHDSADSTDPGRLTLLWHHGSPQTGSILEPLLAAAGPRDIRLLGYGRPSYGGSSPSVGRDVASAADDVRQLIDALGIEHLAVMGASGGGPHALACAALLPDRVSGAVTLAGIAPPSDAFDWYDGMAAPGGLRAAASGWAARATFAETDEFDESSFVAPDWAALQGDWADLGRDAGRAEAAGPDGLIDDDVAFAGPWGFDVTSITRPVLVVQGGQDRVVPASHGRWLAAAIPGAELWFRPDDGHVSILREVPQALDWLLAQIA